MPNITPQMRTRAIVAAVLGNAFEWFDFAIYGMFALVIAKVFFPAGNDANALLATVAIFGAAFIFRPIGGIIFGIYADKFGRKGALVLSIMLMAGGTGLIGLAPSYASVGLLAPIIIVVARLMQGFSVGGEFASATAMLVEFAPENRRGFYGSWQMTSQALAFSLGSLSAYLLTTYLTSAALESWGWRLPFIAGMLLAPIAYYIRRQVDESPIFVAAAAQRPPQMRSPFTEVWLNFPLEILCGFGLIITGAASSYVVIIYLPIFAAQSLSMSLAQVQFSTFLAGLVLLICCPIAGYCSDLIGRKPVLTLAILSYAAAVCPLFAYLLVAPSLASLILVQCSLALGMSFFWGPMPATMAEIFPVQLRSTGIALAFNLGGALFGGIAPLLLTYSLRQGGSMMMPAYYMLATAMAGLAATLWLDFASIERKQQRWLQRS